MFDKYTLGIEEEFQIVDRETCELRSHVSEILDEGRMLLGEQIKPEMIQSMVEVGTGICRNIQEARTDITNLRAVISSLARKKNLEIVAASTHPFSHWRDQTAFDDERYELIIGEMQMVALSRALMGAPGLILFDEPSQGLAPKVVQDVMSAVPALLLRRR